MAFSDRITMFYGAKPDIFEKAAILRETMTPAESVIWDKLKDRKHFKYKFRRQHPIDIFIVDFYCHPLLLIIEIDGGYHLSSDQKEYDTGRSSELENWNLKIIRYTNHEVLNSTANVFKDILEKIEQREKGLGLVK